MKCVVYFCMFFQHFGSTTPVNVECDYIDDSWGDSNSIYQCQVQQNLNIISIQTAQIDDVNGNHKPEKSNQEVTSFYAWDKKIYFFPRNLEKFFTNLNMITIINGQLKEIRQSDLMPFPKLTHLNLGYNLISVIEDGLFDFNPDLVKISLDRNNIFNIHPNVFDNLAKLTDLWLIKNSCIDAYANNDAEKVAEIINEIKLKCFDQKFSSLFGKFKSIEECSKNQHKILECCSISKSTTKSEDGLNSCEKLNAAVDKIESLEKALINIQETFQKFQIEAFSNFRKILEDLEELK